MKKIALLLVFAVLSCQNPYGTVTTEDEKSAIIATVFKNVGDEQIEYLKDVFSDKMELVNSQGASSNKTSFIAGVENMMDLFDDIRFTDMNGDAEGAEIETNTYANGIVWTNIWNTFSATGKYTGQEVNFPFHISYQWEGNKIIKEVQFFDTTEIENEMNAKLAAANASEKIVVLLELKVNNGYSKADVAALVQKLNNFVRANEPNTYDYTYFISTDARKVFLLEKYYSSADMILHAQNFEGGPNFTPFMSTFEVDSFIVAGNATDELKETLKAYPVEYRSSIGGWIY